MKALFQVYITVAEILQVLPVLRHEDKTAVVLVDVTIFIIDPFQDIGDMENLPIDFIGDFTSDHFRISPRPDLVHFVPPETRRRNESHLFQSMQYSRPEHRRRYGEGKEQADSIGILVVEIKDIQIGFLFGLHQLDVLEKSVV